MDLRINAKTYKNVETYTVPKLNHIFNTATEALNGCAKQEDQKYLEDAVVYIENLIDKKLTELKESRKCLNS